ncbi:hypothetical protein HYW54_00540 [Candidatus Gottesmanbacteria bacterium]|nr:hypothetical protein [Candidatus Gottesmanbacteria bacterium]
MNKYQKKILAALSTGAMLLSTFSPAFAADTTLIIGENGANSNNDINVTSTNNQVVNQTNNAVVTNNINVDAETGNNDANNNTGGDVDIETGNASANVNVSNLLNKNVANIDCCDAGNTEVLIAENGYNSDNNVNLNKTSNIGIWQNNKANVTNNLDVDADTGDNDAEKNTGGNVTVKTGDASANVSVSTVANANKAFIGDGNGSGSKVSAWIVGNGANSNNDINLTLNKSINIDQYNNAYVTNNLDVDAETGNNDANNNTGGDVTIDTGAASADVVVDNLLNLNWADVPCDCLLGDIFAKIAKNGADSDNDIKAHLKDNLGLWQDNYTYLKNKLWVDADSGDNDAEKNTGGVNGGDPSITTGDAEADVAVFNTGDANIYGDPGPWWPLSWGEIEVNVTISLDDLLDLLGL